MKVAIIGENVNSILCFRSELMKMPYENNHKVYIFAIDYNKHYKNRLQYLSGEYVIQRDILDITT